MSWSKFVDQLPGLLILIPVLILSMSAHELAHGWVAYRLGDPTAKRAGRLSFNPLRHLDPVGTAMFFVTYLFSGFVFGWAKPVPVSPYYFKNRQRGMALVGLAGPVTNFILAIVFIVILNAIHPASDGLLFETFFQMFQVNVVLGLFNLIPIPPLDGSRVLGAFLPRSAYEKWVTLDRYGMILVMLVVFVLWNPVSRALAWAINGLAEVFLTNYFIVS
jgi:Zn-dependent protease